MDKTSDNIINDKREAQAAENAERKEKASEAMLERRKINDEYESFGNSHIDFTDYDGVDNYENDKNTPEKQPENTEDLEIPEDYEDYYIPKNKDKKKKRRRKNNNTQNNHYNNYTGQTKYMPVRQADITDKKTQNNIHDKGNDEYQNYSESLFYREKRIREYERGKEESKRENADKRRKYPFDENKSETEKYKNEYIPQTIKTTRNSDENALKSSAYNTGGPDLLHSISHIGEQYTDIAENRYIGNKRKNTDNDIKTEHKKENAKRVQRVWQEKRERERINDNFESFGRSHIDFTEDAYDNAAKTYSTADSYSEELYYKEKKIREYEIKKADEKRQYKQSVQAKKEEDNKKESYKSRYSPQTLKSAKGQLLSTVGNTSDSLGNHNSLSEYKGHTAKDFNDDIKAEHKKENAERVQKAQRAKYEREKSAENFESFGRSHIDFSNGVYENKQNAEEAGKSDEHSEELYYKEKKIREYEIKKADEKREHKQKTYSKQEAERDKSRLHKDEYFAKDTRQKLKQGNSGEYSSKELSRNFGTEALKSSKSDSKPEHKKENAERVQKAQAEKSKEGKKEGKSDISESLYAEYPEKGQYGPQFKASQEKTHKSDDTNNRNNVPENTLGQKGKTFIKANFFGNDMTEYADNNISSGFAHINYNNRSNSSNDGADMDCYQTACNDTRSANSEEIYRNEQETQYAKIHYDNPRFNAIFFEIGSYLSYLEEKRNQYNAEPNTDRTSSVQAAWRTMNLSDSADNKQILQQTDKSDMTDNSPYTYRNKKDNTDRNNITDTAVNTNITYNISKTGISHTADKSENTGGVYVSLKAKQNNTSGTEYSIPRIKDSIVTTIGTEAVKISFETVKAAAGSVATATLNIASDDETIEDMRKFVRNVKDAVGIVKMMMTMPHSVKFMKNVMRNAAARSFDLIMSHKGMTYFELSARIDYLEKAGPLSEMQKKELKHLLAERKKRTASQIPLNTANARRLLASPFTVKELSVLREKYGNIANLSLQEIERRIEFLEKRSMGLSSKDSVLLEKLKELRELHKGKLAEYTAIKKLSNRRLKKEIKKLKKLRKKGLLDKKNENILADMKSTLSKRKIVKKQSRISRNRRIGINIISSRIRSFLAKANDETVNGILALTDIASNRYVQDITIKIFGIAGKANRAVLSFTARSIEKSAFAVKSAARSALKRQEQLAAKKSADIISLRKTAPLKKTGALKQKHISGNIRSAINKAAELAKQTAEKAAENIAAAVKSAASNPGAVCVVILAVIIAVLVVILMSSVGAISRVKVMETDENILEYALYIQELKTEKENEIYSQIIDKMAEDGYSTDSGSKQVPEESMLITKYYTGTTEWNTKEIISMAAVYFNQDLQDKDRVKEYIKNLFELSNQYSYEFEAWDDEGTIYECYHFSTHGADYFMVKINMYINVFSFEDIFYLDPQTCPIGETVSGENGVSYTAGEFIGNFRCSYYCNEAYAHICNDGENFGKTASGTSIVPGRTIAVDPAVIPIGTHVIINGHEYVAEDTGGAIKGNKIDIAVNLHDEAMDNGVKYFNVYKAEAQTGAAPAPTPTGLFSGMDLGFRWTSENREWAKQIYEQDWNEMYPGLSGYLGAMESEYTGTSDTALSDDELQDLLGDLPADLSEERKAVISWAAKAVGQIPYYWGGSASCPGFDGNNFNSVVEADYKGRDKKGLDCSHFVDWVYWSAVGNNLGNGSTVTLWSKSSEINKANLKIGDLGFKQTPSSGGTNHVGIYAGNNKWIHCSSSGGVKISNSDTMFSYYRRIGFMT